MVWILIKWPRTTDGWRAAANCESTVAPAIARWYRGAANCWMCHRRSVSPMRYTYIDKESLRCEWHFNVLCVSIKNKIDIAIFIARFFVFKKTYFQDIKICHRIISKIESEHISKCIYVRKPLNTVQSKVNFPKPPSKSTMKYMLIVCHSNEWYIQNSITLGK